MLSQPPAFVILIRSRLISALLNQHYPLLPCTFLSLCMHVLVPACVDAVQLSRHLGLQPLLCMNAISPVSKKPIRDVIEPTICFCLPKLYCREIRSCSVCIF